MGQLGIVAIGRNEGERLRKCLTSVVGRGMPVVYVDGNSTDGSVDLARSLGADVIVEDPSQRNCAAMARNAGFERACRLDPDVRFVQFIDGDCEVVAGWLDRALRVFEERPDVALVTGRRRERHPDLSAYNRLADIEWDAPVGEEIRGSHGDVMVRVDAFRQVGGFDVTMKVSEDTELCLRLQQAGWVLLRIAAEMTLHDMAMTRFGQWWRRCIRTGYGYAQGALMHGRSPQPLFRSEVYSIVFWGIALPLLILVLALATRGAGLILALAYPLQMLRIAARHHRAGMALRDAWLYGWSCTVSKIAFAIGLVRFRVERLLGQNRVERVITYK
jgi:GT2 family glycosyltransferase